MGLSGDTSVSPEMLLVLDSDGKRPEKMLNILRHTRWSHDRELFSQLSVVAKLQNLDTDTHTHTV